MVKSGCMSRELDDRLIKDVLAMCESVGDFYDFLHDVIDEHEAKYNIEDGKLSFWPHWPCLTPVWSSEPSCLLDTMRQDYVKGKFTYSDIFHTVQSMLIAAIDTTSTQTAIVWSNLARWPEWQEPGSKDTLPVQGHTPSCTHWQWVTVILMWAIIADDSLSVYIWPSNFTFGAFKENCSWRSGKYSLITNSKMGWRSKTSCFHLRNNSMESSGFSKPLSHCNTTNWMCRIYV